MLDRIGRLEDQLRSGFESLGDLPHVGDVRVIGGVAAVELVSKPGTKDGGGYFDEIGQQLAETFLARGLLIRPLGSVVYFMPPYVISDDETAWALETIRTVLEDLVW